MIKLKYLSVSTNSRNLRNSILSLWYGLGTAVANTYIFLLGPRRPRRRRRRRPEGGKAMCLFRGALGETWYSPLGAFRTRRMLPVRRGFLIDGNSIPCKFGQNLTRGARTVDHQRWELGEWWCVCHDFDRCQIGCVTAGNWLKLIYIFKLGLKLPETTKFGNKIKKKSENFKFSKKIKSSQKVKIRSKSATTGDKHPIGGPHL